MPGDMPGDEKIEVDLTLEDGANCQRGQCDQPDHVKGRENSQREIQRDRQRAKNV